MKQKILYILMIITALIGGNAEAWAQDGYSEKTYTFVSSHTTNSKDVQNGAITFSSENHKIYDEQSYDLNIVFSLGSSLRNFIAGSGREIVGGKTNTVSWAISSEIASSLFLKINSFSSLMYSTASGSITFTPLNGNSTKFDFPGLKNVTIDLANLNLNKDASITLITEQKWYSPVYYVKSLTFNYTLSYYELDVSSLESAITTANNASKDFITDETMKSYLNTAIANANSFKEECAFPNSYWNGSSVGKTPAEVTSTAEKLNAITNYLIARTNANKYEQSKVPNAVYDWLHTYDQYNPNDFDANTINTATNDINSAISAANATTSAYQRALTTIDLAENSFDKTNDEGQGTLTADIKNAKKQLEQAQSVEEINSALANIKSFDAITFNADSEIEEEATLPNPAYAHSGKAITYKSSDDKIIEIDGTTLKALKPGTVTITATTTTGDGYYGYTTTKEFTVTPKAVILNPVNECTVVPNVVYPEITLNRTFIVGHSTLALPFDTNISDFSDDSEAYAAQLSLVTYNKVDGYTLYFKKVADGQMQANQPYVVNLPSTKESFTWTNVEISSVTPLDKEEGQGERFQGWTMRANYTPGVSMEGMYGIAGGKDGIAGGKLCIGITGSTINAYTAYFIPPVANARVRMAVLDDDGGVTYIDDVREDGDAIGEAEQIYRLDGTRQTTLTKGINIVKMANGEVRKVLK